MQSIRLSRAATCRRRELGLHYKGDEARHHLVPLPTQAVATLTALRALTGRGPFLFPNQRHAHRPASENAIGYLLNRAGYHHRHVPHGWRATFSAVMNERFKHDRHIIDRMLARRTASRAPITAPSILEQRIELAQEWADLLVVGQMPVDDLVKLRRRPSPLNEQAGVL